MIRRLAAWVAAGAFALVATLGGVPATAAPTPPACDGVLVVVDFAALGGQQTGCADDFDSGTRALIDAGFVPSRSGGMICSISGLPTSCAVTMDAYWSYWQASRNADGSFGPWTYAALGPDSYQPRRGDAEGWRFGDGRTPPSPLPARAATTTASATASASASASTSTSASGAPTSMTASATTTPTSRTPSSGAPQSGPSGDGGPTGLIVTLAILAAAGAAVGWWLWRRR